MLIVLGLVSDIHGNSIALEAVIADGEQVGVDEWLVLGDIVALGHDPVGTLEMLASIRASCLSGNTERYVLRGDLPHPSPDDVRRDVELLSVFQECVASFNWTRGALTQAGWIDWLDDLPSELRRTLPCGTRMLAVHASPGTDDGEGLANQISDAALRAMTDGIDADLVLGGHTHEVMDRQVGDVRVVNLGSVSNAKRPDRMASYVVIEPRASGYTLQHRYVDYDHQAVIEALDTCRHPAAQYLQRFQQAT